MLSCLVAFICLGKGGFDLALDSALAEGVIGGVVAGALLSIPVPYGRVEVPRSDG